MAFWDEVKYERPQELWILLEFICGGVGVYSV
jgi:hypothetical protein